MALLYVYHGGSQIDRDLPLHVRTRMVEMCGGEGIDYKRCPTALLTLHGSKFHMQRGLRDGAREREGEKQGEEGGEGERGGGTERDPATRSFLCCASSTYQVLLNDYAGLLYNFTEACCVKQRKPRDFA